MNQSAFPVKFWLPVFTGLTGPYYWNIIILLLANIGMYYSKSLHLKVQTRDYQIKITRSIIPKLLITYSLHT